MYPMFEKTQNQKVRGYIKRDNANVFDGRWFNEIHNWPHDFGQVNFSEPLFPW